jgi:taurine dioxygenase
MGVTPTQLPRPAAPRTLELRKLAAIGAEIDGIDLAAPLADDEVAALQAALLAHGVLVFRRQALDGEQLLALARRFGKLFVQPVFSDTFKELLVLTNDEKRPPMLNTFHQDMTGLECPPAEHLLHALEVPAGGGDTIWSCNYRAFESLSAPLRAFVSGLTATHSVSHAYRTAFERMPNGREIRGRIEAEHPPAHHPVVRTHPESGRKGLFVNRFFTQRIDDLKPDESALLLEHLFRVIENPDFCFRLRWEVGTLAIWDNRCTSHYAVADYYPQRRRMQRASVCGDKPV